MTLEILISALLRLPIYKDDLPATPDKQTELRNIAAAVYTHAKGDLQVMAMTLAIGKHESGFSSKVGRGECRPKQCDPRRRKDGTIEHRARGWFQVHRNGMSQEAWDELLGPNRIDAQAKEAVRRVRSAFATCKGEPDPISSAFAQYGGAGCKGQKRLKDMPKRIESYYSIRRFIP